MKRNLIVLIVSSLIVLSLFVGCKSEPEQKTEPAVTYKVGDKGPAGGVIVYDAGSVQKSTYLDKDGKSVDYEWQYLEAAPEDLTIKANGDDVHSFVFGYSRNVAEGTNTVATTENTNTKKTALGGGGNAAIGQGRYNTTALVNKMGDEAYQRDSGEVTTSNYAAKLCDDYKVGDYDDWFLPSLDELDAIFKASDNAAGLRASEYDEYWSSSENDGNFAFGIYFGGEEKGVEASQRVSYNYIRAIRAFK